MSKSEYYLGLFGGITVAIIVISSIGYGIYGDCKCKRQLSDDSAKITLGHVIDYRVRYSRKRTERITTFKTPIGNFTTTEIEEPIPIGIPIYIQYIENDLRCRRFLWDSVIVWDKEHFIRYKYIEGKGYKFDYYHK